MIEDSNASLEALLPGRAKQSMPVTKGNNINNAAIIPTYLIKVTIVNNKVVPITIKKR